jgi:predicted MFS family arabinose efflux permease
LLARTFKAFQYPDFRVMWMGACVSSVGTWMQILAQSWLVYQLSNSAVYLGLDAFFGQIPIFLFSLFGGAFADRHSRCGILLASQGVQLSCAFILAFLAGEHMVKVWHIWCLSFTVGCAQAFGGPAYSALIPSLVKKEDLQNAIALNSIQFNLARVVGPALGGLALNGLGAMWCFGLNGVSYLAVIASLLMIKADFKPAPSTTSVVTSIKEGISFVRQQEGMVSLIVLAFCVTLLSYPLITFLPVMARDVFHGGANTFTLFLCLSGAGSVTGALIIAALGKQGTRAKVSLLVMLALGALIIGFGLSKNLHLSVLIVFCTGALLMVVFAVNTSLVQTYVTDAMRGRVMSVYNAAFRGGMPLGSAISGLLVKQTSAPVMMATNGVAVVLLATYFLLLGKKLSKL